MIVRVWRGRVRHGAGPKYLAHLESSVFPEIRALPGNLGARVLRGVVGAKDDFLVLTEWASMDAVTGFAGADPEVAVVPAEARALLAEYDETVRHYEIALDLE